MRGGGGGLVARERHRQQRLSRSLQLKVFQSRNFTPGVVESRFSLSCRDAVSSNEEQPMRLTGRHEGARGFCSILLAVV